MVNMMRNMARSRFDRGSMALLWIESVIFSVIYGLGIHSWVVTAVLFAVLFALLRGQGTAVYSIFVLSFLWAFIFAAVGFGIGGWVGAMILGGLVFSHGVRLHFRDLKRSWADQVSFQFADAGQWRRNWYLPGQNLN